MRPLSPNRFIEWTNAGVPSFARSRRTLDVKMRLTQYAPLVAATLLTGCALQVVLPVAQHAATLCALQVTDTRSEPNFMLARQTANLRLELVPPISTSLRAAVCAEPAQQDIPSGSRFVISDFDCQVSGLFELIATVDLRGRLELPGSPSMELRASEVAIGAWATIAGACQGPVERVPQKLATQILAAVAASRSK